MTSPRSLAPLLAALALVASACRPADPRTVVVARAEGITLSAADLEAALAGRADAAAVRRDRAALTSLITDVLVDEVLGAEARRTVPGAEPRARAAGRQAVIRAMLDPGAPAEAILRARYADDRSQYGTPAEVRLAWIVLASCAEAPAVLDEITAGKLSFAAAALKHSTERQSAVKGGEVGWRRLDSLPPPLRQAVAPLAPADGRPALGPAVPTDPAGLPGRGPAARGPQGCVIPQVLERRAAVTPAFEEVRDKVARAAGASALGTARRELVQRLAAKAPVTVRDAGLGALAEPAGRDDEYVVSAGGEHVTVGEARAVLGEAARRAGLARRRAMAQQLGEDLLLWREAVRRGLAASPTVRGAERAALVADLRERLAAAAAAASQPAGAVEAAYHAALGDYTDPFRVRLAALVTRDRKKADAWAKALRAAKFPADAFERLLPESEESSGRRTGGDLGWVDGRTSSFPDSFKEAVLRLKRPGEVAGPLPTAGAFMVVLCRDYQPERVRPLVEVEGEIRARLATQAREARLRDHLAAVRARVKPVIDWSVVERMNAGR
jgi:parvulin-like peptidyl-prolyl isomerase